MKDRGEFHRPAAFAVTSGVVYPGYDTTTEGKMTEKRSRGRPVTYDYQRRRELAELICEYGARGTQDLVDHPIALETLLKIAREFRVDLKPGRRPRRAA